MTIEQAIQKAKDGGWVETQAHKYNALGYDTIIESAVFLDVTFWVALGKALQWGMKHYSSQPFLGGIEVLRTAKHRCNQNCTVGSWRVELHRFIDHLASGKTAESFFEAL